MDRNRSKLLAIRKKIDRVDDRITELLKKRATLVGAVFFIKNADLGQKPVFYRPAREAMILKRVTEKDCSPFQKRHVVAIFRSIISACLDLEAQINIAFLGPSGTFSEIAARQHFGEFVKLTPCLTISDIFHAVELKKTDLGIIPIKNSIGGFVKESIHCLNNTFLSVIGEDYLIIHQCFMVNVKAVDKILRVYSHEQSLKQCESWLNKYYPGIEKIPVSSNALAAKRAAADMHSAAIGAEVAAELYSLKLLHKNIEDKANNVTRFFIISHEKDPPTGDDKTAILVRAKNQKIVTGIHDLNIDVDVSLVEKSKKEYLFFIETKFHNSDNKFSEILKYLKKHEIEYKILGSYPVSLKNFN